VTHPVWQTRQGRRAASLAAVLKWPLIGAMIAGGALLVARELGPPIASELGARGGEGFARGVAEAQARMRRLAVSGWGRWR